MSEEESIQRIPLDKQMIKKKKGANIIDISADDAFISMDQPFKKAQNMRKERVKTKKSVKAKRKKSKGCGCK
jgi:hypothetical protein